MFYSFFNLILLILSRKSFNLQKESSNKRLYTLFITFKSEGKIKPPCARKELFLMKSIKLIGTLLTPFCGIYLPTTLLLFFIYSTVS